jgi:hypothetical protein
LDYYSTSNNDEHIKILGNLEFKVPTITLNKLITTTTGNWSMAWNKTSCATVFAFPHRRNELASYGEAIISLVGTTHITFHSCVIAYDCAVCCQVGSCHDIELTSFHKFFDLHTSHMDNIGAAVTHVSEGHTQGVPCKKQEACNQWNQGLCMLEESTCCHLHICNICSAKDHKNLKWPTVTKA